MHATVLGLLLALCGAAEAQRFEQQKFVVSFFVDPPLDEHAPRYYREISDAHFNVALGGYSAREREQVRQQLRLCRRSGLKAIVAGHGAEVEELPDGRACMGYIVRDEPGVQDFPELRERVDALRTARPGMLALINLFPSYCEPERLGAPTYDEYVRQYMEQVQPDVLCMDHYPFMTPERDTRERYLEDLAVMRKHSMAAGIPFWNFFNTMPFGPHYDPTEAQLRWQVFASVAYGAKGVLYFCYYTPEGAEFPRGGAILTRDGRLTRHYQEAKRINAVLKAWGPLLMSLTSEGVSRVRSAGAENTEGHLLSVSEGEFIVGRFRTQDGRRAVLMLNHEAGYSAWPTVTFNKDVAQVLEVSPKDGSMAQIIDDSPAMDGMQMSFDSGGARLLVMP